MKNSEKSTFIHLIIILLVWTIIFLTGLGKQEIKGEEGRRILPARNMLKSNDYVVMKIGGKIYTKKPPMMSWLIAGSFKLLNKQNEFTSRIPSAILILVLAFTIYFCTIFFIGKKLGLLTSLICITSIGIIEKGRLAEIEASLIAFTAMAYFIWINAWLGNQKKRLLYWTKILACAVCIAFGMLCKIGVPLIFFLTVSLFSFLYKKENITKFLLSQALILAMSFIIFNTWFAKNKQEIRKDRAKIAQNDNFTKKENVWIKELKDRVFPKNFSFTKWLSNPLQAGFNFFPWVIFFFFIKYGKLQRYLMASFLITLIGISILPASEGRYSMPILPLGAFIIAISFKTKTIISRTLLVSLQNLYLFIFLFSTILYIYISTKYTYENKIDNFFIIITLLASFLIYFRFKNKSLINYILSVFLVILCLNSILVPAIKEKDEVRAFGSIINTKKINRIAIFRPNPSFQPLFFYIKKPYEIYRKKSILKENIYNYSHLLIQNKELDEISVIINSSNLIQEIQSDRGKNFLLYKLGNKISKKVH